jgi:hypothetical protein
MNIDWLVHFQRSTDDAAIDARIHLIPVPLSGLHKLPALSAKDTYRNTLRELFIPTGQHRELIKELYEMVLRHIERTYSSNEAYVQRCNTLDLREIEFDPNFIMILCGLARVGKSHVSRAIVRFRVDIEPASIALPGMPTFRVDKVWRMKMKTGGDLKGLLTPCLPQALGSEDELIMLAAKRCFTNLVALLLADEFQFVTLSENASAKASKILMRLATIGCPLITCSNFTLLNKLYKRPQQERRRLLERVRFIFPELIGSPEWIKMLQAQLNVAPEIYSSDKSIKLASHGEMLYNYTYGISDYAAKLLTLAYSEARSAGRHIVEPDDVVRAYVSADYLSSRQDVELLKGQDVKKKSMRNDLWCDHYFESLEKYKASELSKMVTPIRDAIDEFARREEEKLLISGLNREERLQAESKLAELERATGTGKIVRMKRPKATKEGLLSGYRDLEAE